LFNAIKHTVFDAKAITYHDAFCDDAIRFMP